MDTALLNAKLVSIDQVPDAAVAPQIVQLVQSVVVTALLVKKNTI